MIIIFIGPPFSGKDTQAKLLGEKLNLPVYSMGGIIRKAYEKGDPRAIEGFEKYSMKGQHVPIRLKFDLLREKLEKTIDGFILDNFPATQEDLDTFNKYLLTKNLNVNRVFLMNVSREEMIRRMVNRGRGDDEQELVMKRREIQDEDRKPVIEYFITWGLLAEIDSEGKIEDVHKQIIEKLNG
ncbi:MAG: nucleoside monophosphate kinase [Candidatus Levybacteria bacterium]|nr:nucleoside monophosphate kinase [Candidatus Levybacteria bacterium]